MKTQSFPLNVEIVDYEPINERNSVKSDKKKLSICTPKFERHPSASKLMNDCDSDNKSSLSIQMPEKEILPSSAPSSPFTITLNESDNPLYDKNDIFYIKRKDSSKEKNVKKESDKHFCVKSKFFSLTPEQITLDKKITESIKKGEDFKSIKNMFKGLLVKKE